jgi:hypothetical protein
MKLRSRFAWLLAALAATALGVSCATAPTIPLRDNVAIKRTAYGSPSDSVLVYGSATQVKTIFGAGPIDNLEMVQLNPAQKPMIITPARSGPVFFTEPLPLGSSLRFFYFSIKQGRTITFYERGVQGQGPTDRRLAKPGLLYLGALIYCDKQYLVDKKFSFRALDESTMDLYPTGDGKEIDALKSLLPKFRGTDWEPVITARIEELKK